MLSEAAPSYVGLSQASGNADPSVTLANLNFDP